MILNPLTQDVQPASLLHHTWSPVLPALPEANVQQNIRLHWSKKGGRLWRNNVGAEGRLRYGLANDSKQLNKQMKSSDLIGITPTIITQDMVGKLAGIFTSIEVKRSGWRYRNTDDRQSAQLKWLELVYGMGGIAGFYAGEAL